jgi:deoxycytidylate deaminase
MTTTGAKAGATMSQRPELVFGFVAPIGVRLRDLLNETSVHLRGFDYNPIEIRLSQLLQRFAGWKAPATSSEDGRIINGQNMGHAFRERLNDPAGLVRAALAAIREKRAELTGAPDKPASGVAYLLNQLKHPREVKLLRDVYGPSFILIAAHAYRETRISNLIRRIAESEGRSAQDDDASKAINIIRIDDEESSKDLLGQNTRNTYPLADMFIDLEAHSRGEFAVDRFIDLLFGHPFHTPQPEEVAMYAASAAALRSSDDSRQVGAVIVDVRLDGRGSTTNVEVVATGMNEVPMRGGGFYWDGATNSPDARDQWLIAWGPNDDRALEIKKGVLSELLEVFKREGWFTEHVATEQTPALMRRLIGEELLKGTQFLSLGEFQRQVHAEMSALIDAARRGVAVDRHTMFVTTFPCHNCAKHIIAAGIRHVIYLEPYPKSRAHVLHKEEIDLETKVSLVQEQGSSGSVARVVFSPYTGIAPRQYRRLFGMSGRGSKVLFGLRDWGQKKKQLNPQHLLRNAFAAYTMAEREELAYLPPDVFTWDPSSVCPPSK